jgi:hypothetical protein
MLPVISGHRDGPGATECPGQSLYLRLPRLQGRGPERGEWSGLRTVAAVSAASFAVEAVAPDSIAGGLRAAIFAAGDSARPARLPLPEQLAGSSVRIVDRLNEEFVAPLFHVSPGQVNLPPPRGLLLDQQPYLSIPALEVNWRLEASTSNWQPLASFQPTVMARAPSWLPSPRHSLPAG